MTDAEPSSPPVRKRPPRRRLFVIAVTVVFIAAAGAVAAVMAWKQTPPQVSLPLRPIGENERYPRNSTVPGFLRRHHGPAHQPADIQIAVADAQRRVTCRYLYVVDDEFGRGFGGGAREGGVVHM